MACRYYLHGRPSPLYNELFGYMDNTKAANRTVKAFHKILAKYGISNARKYQNSYWINQANLEPALREVGRINRKYPGLLTTRFIRTTPKHYHSPESEAHTLAINEYLLQTIVEEGDVNADFVSNDEVEIDQYVRFIAGEENQTQDYYLDEMARRENSSDQSKFSDLKREEIEIVEKKAALLKESFARAGVTVDIKYNTELDSIAEVFPGEENPVIAINPNKAKEDTVYHEFGHIYIDMLGVTDPVVARAIAELKQTPLYDQVEQNYPELKGEMLDKEVLATAIGLEGAKITRKEPTLLQQIVNRILRAFGKVFGIQPSGAAIIAQEMFANKLRSEAMLNPLSPYTQKSKDQAKFEDILLNVKVRIESEIYEVEKLPVEEKEKNLLRLQRLQAGLDKVEKIEDLTKFVDAIAGSLGQAYNTYTRIMSLPREERTSDENMNLIYNIKKELDALDVIKPIKEVMLKTKKLNKILDQTRFTRMEDRIRSILDTKEDLESDFNDDILPIMATRLSGYHNEALDPQIQAQIDNAIKYKRTQGLKKNTEEYVKLRERFKNGDLTDEQFLDKQVELKVEQLKRKQIPGYGDLLDQLRSEHQDKSWASYMFDPLIYSSNTAIQLFVKSVQDAQLKADDMTRELKGDLAAEYNVFAEGMSEFDTEKLYDDIVETVNVKDMERLSLINPIDTNKYYKNKKEIKEDLKTKHGVPVLEEGETWDSQSYKDKYKAWKRKNYNAYKLDVLNWEEANSKPVPGWEKEYKTLTTQIAEAKKILATLDKYEDRKAQIRTEEYVNQELRLRALQSTLDANTVKTNQGIKPSGAWRQPDPTVYTNPKYTKIQNDPRLKRFYEFALKEFQKGHRMIGTTQMDKNEWDEYSYLMPSIRKMDIDRLVEQGAWTAITDKLKTGVTVEDTSNEYGTYNKNSGELNEKVPIYYVNRVPAKDISRDVANSIYMFRHMAHNYQEKSKIVGHVMLFREIIDNLDVVETNASGIPIINKVAEKFGKRLSIKKEGETYLFKHAKEWIDMNMFGQSELKQNFTIAGKEVSGTQLAGTLNAFTAISTLSFNLLQGVNQSILDNMTMLQEGLAQQFMSKGDWVWGKSKYWSEGGAIGDIGRFDPQSKLGKALEFFDALTEFHDQEGNTIVGSKARKLLNTNNLMFLQQMAEHELSASRLLGLMRSYKGKLKDSNGDVIKNEEGQDADLWDVLKQNDKGVMFIDPKVTNFNRLDFIGLVQGLSRRTNQTKGKIHSDMASRRTIGKLGMLFRKWINPGIRRRYGHGGGWLGGSSLHIDEEMGVVSQGMYISFWNMMTESYSKQQLPWTTYKTMTEMERQNVKRTLVEQASLLGAIALVGALANIDDDEETWVSNFALYQAKRYETEIRQWTPIVGLSEAFRIMRSPTATARPIEQGVKLINQLIRKDIPYFMGAPWADEKDIYYQKKSGRFEKGDRKLIKKVQDIFPIWRGFIKSENPKEAYKWFTTLDK